MPRVKRPTKKTRGASSSMEPLPQDHPLTQWFYNKEDFDLYLSDFAPRKVVAYTTLDVEFEEDDLVFSFKIGKNTYALESSELSAIWSLNYNGEKIESGHASEDFRRNYSKENACTMFNVGLLNVERRLLHYFLTYVLVPRSGNHG
ncbi:hypothetical protein PIB30_079785 [Stylosanthes scabra]|uniref:Uncharacterized protein n=1 Tax=Stylosanthes scabra TaxID=79078 RepID=A0ABU6XQ54_9FABA|nr:hypothetical protein [Stylosanthes scabra]